MVFAETSKSTIIKSKLITLNMLWGCGLSKDSKIWPNAFLITTAIQHSFKLDENYNAIIALLTIHVKYEASFISAYFLTLQNVTESSVIKQ